jgi:hypothetical protein
VSTSEHDSKHDAAEAPHRMRMPGFIRDDREIGLGDVVARVTYARGIGPCGGCERRRAALNRWLAFRR